MVGVMGESCIVGILMNSWCVGFEEVEWECERVWVEFGFFVCDVICYGLVELMEVIFVFC